MTVRELFLETPTLELVRGKIGRLGWKRRLRTSGLPSDIQHAIRRIAGQWRLFRHERARIADELITHFQDGGTLADFGDINAARKQFRRALIAKRGWWWHATKAVTALVLVVVAYYGFLTVRFFTATPTVTTSLSAAMLELIPSSTRAPSGLRPLADRIAAAQSPLNETLSEDQHAPGITDGVVPEAWQAWLDAHPALVREVHDALAAGPTWPITDDLDKPYADPILVIERDYTHRLRSMHGLLLHSAIHQLRRGEIDRFLDEFAAAHAVADHFAEVPSLSFHRWANATRRYQLDALAASLESRLGHFSPEQLRTLTRIIDRPLPQADATADRLAFDRHVESVYANGRLTDAVSNPATLDTFHAHPNASTVGIVWESAVTWDGLLRCGDEHAVRVKFDHMIDAAEQAARRPEAFEFQRAARLAREPVEFSGGVEWFVLREHIPFVHTGHANAVTLMRGALLIRIAAEQYRREHGRWPTEPGDLSPRYLATQPADVFSGKPLRFSTASGHVKAWSVGPDGDVMLWPRP
ncbi:MAG: hypothetical protein AAF656_08760 [Planctomycetota bacterium]